MLRLLLPKHKDAIFGKKRVILVWIKEDEDCQIMYKQPHQNYLLFNVSDKPYYIVWWILADLFPSKIRMCEIMASLLCDTSLLKSTDYRLKRKTYGDKVCPKCEQWVLETIFHVVMQCPYHTDEQLKMNAMIVNLNNESATQVLNDSQNFFFTIMGKQPDGISFESMIDIWLIAGECVSRMYKRTLRGERG